MKHNVLTNRTVETVTKPGRYGDGMGLYLQASRFGTKSWVFRYDVAGATREMGLGSVKAVSLKLARELARQQRELLLKGEDPIEIRKAKRERIREVRESRHTFAECAEGYLAKHAGEWENDKHRHQVKSSLALASKHFGDVATIDTSSVVAFLEPIWRKTPATGSRVATRIASVLDWATAAGYREGPNPARWKGHLEHLLAAAPKTVHMDAMAFEAVPGFMEKLRAEDTIVARCLEFTILTAARSGEARGARWDEIQGDVWAIPAARMKSRREHRVPLCTRAVEILESLPRDGSGLVFFGRFGGRPVGDNSLLALIKRLSGNGHAVHGFRSSFRDWAAERTAYAREIFEMCLAHAVAGKTEASYWRSDILEKRRRLMESWSQFCEQPATSATVTSLRRA